MESCFVPVLVRNNVEGYEREVLERYDEPTWNNPVLRFLDAEGRDVLPRRDRVWSLEAVGVRLTEALAAAEREVPSWLELALTARAEDPGRAVLTLHCFWVGEAALAPLPGVLDVRAGWLDGREVVDVRYDRARLPAGELLARAAELGCLDGLHTDDADLDRVARERGVEVRALREEPRPAEAADQLHALRATDLRHLPLPRPQALRVNAALAAGEAPAPWLSPRQRQLLADLRAARARSEDALEGLDALDEGRSLLERTDALRARLRELADGPAATGTGDTGEAREAEAGGGDPDPRP